MTRAQRIAKAREDLAARYAADPAAVAGFEARMARLAAARKRERERVEMLVLGGKRPTEKRVIGKRHGKRKPTRKVVPVELTPGIEEAVQLRERWQHKANGTAETHEAASRTHQGALAQLFANGTIDIEQLEWAAQIANVHRTIEADVAVLVASLEARVDQSRNSDSIVTESLHRIRMSIAYTQWREALPHPRQMVLDMIVGDAIGYSVAARRYRVHNRKARRVLIEAINDWPGFVDRAYRLWSDDEIERVRLRAAII